ncbi:MAG: GTPase, partial [Acidimicrobiales bacterium]
MERLGLVGLPNSGKSSLFNALTGREVTVASHPFSTTETSTGLAQVPDHRLDALAGMSHSRKVVPASVELVDIAGLVAGAATGEGLGNRFLGGIREVDALCLVLRAFEDPEVPGGSDPVEDLSVLELELVLSDLDRLETFLERRRKAARSDRSLAGEVAALEAAQVPLAAGTPLYRAGLSTETREALRSSFLLTDKPVLAVVNLGEDQVDLAEKLVEGVSAELAGGESGGSGSGGSGSGGSGSGGGGSGGGEVLGVSVQLEAEAAQLPVGERSEMLEGLGLGSGALPRVAAAAYHLLGRRTFLTTG